MWAVPQRVGVCMCQGGEQGGGGHTCEGKPQALRFGYPMPAKTV